MNFGLPFGLCQSKANSFPGLRIQFLRGRMGTNWTCGWLRNPFASRTVQKPNDFDLISQKKIHTMGSIHNMCAMGCLHCNTTWEMGCAREKHGVMGVQKARLSKENHHPDQVPPGGIRLEQPSMESPSPKCALFSPTKSCSDVRELRPG